MSRPEVLFLLSVLIIIVSIIVPTRVAIRQYRVIAMTKSDLSALLLASTRFYDEYGTWPSGRLPEDGDVLYGRKIPNREVLNVLRNQDGAGNPGRSVNPHQISFLAVENWSKGLSGLNESGDFLDAWGTAYQIVLDINLDNTCENQSSIYSSLNGYGIVAWSCGPDRISNNADDILSWRDLPRPR